MHSQSQLDQIWNDLISNKFAGTPSPPKVLSNDHIENAMSIPNQDGVGEVSYRRKPGHAWEEVPLIGTAGDFR